MKMHIYVSNIDTQRFFGQLLFRRFFAVFFQTLYVNSGVGFPGLSHVFSFSMCLRHCTTVQKHDIIMTEIKKEVDNYENNH